MTNTKPYVVAALCCDRVIEENDGVLSAIRIIDQVIFDAANPAPAPTGQGAVAKAPADLNQGAVLIGTADVWLLVALKAGDLQGSFRLGLDILRPNGETAHLFEDFSVTFGPDRDGANVKSRFSLPPFAPPGTYWFLVMWEGEELTRFPLKLATTSGLASSLMMSSSPQGAA